MKRMLAVAVLAALTACGSSGGSGGTSGGAKGDASADLACTHFRNVAGDAAAGILSFEELRGKLQEVYGSAKYSDTPGIADGAQRLLADVTAPDAVAFKSDLTAFTQACTDAGF